MTYINASQMLSGFRHFEATVNAAVRAALDKPVALRVVSTPTCDTYIHSFRHPYRRTYIHTEMTPNIQIMNREAATSGVGARRPRFDFRCASPDS